MKMRIAATLVIMLFTTRVLLCTKSHSHAGGNADNVLKELQGSMTFQVWQYDSCKVKQKYTILAEYSKAVTPQIEHSTWKCDVTKSPMNNDGSVAVAAKFKVEKGSMASAAAAITIDLAGWSTSNYVMDYGSVLSGKRSEQSVKGGGYDHVPFRCKK